MNVRPALHSSLRVSYANDVVPHLEYFNTGSAVGDRFIKPGHVAGAMASFMTMGLVTLVDQYACIPVRAAATTVGTVSGLLGASVGIMTGSRERAVNGFIAGMDISQGAFQAVYCVVVHIVQAAALLIGVAVGIAIGAVALGFVILEQMAIAESEKNARNTNSSYSRKQSNG